MLGDCPVLVCRASSRVVVRRITTKKRCVCASALWSQELRRNPRSFAGKLWKSHMVERVGRRCDFNASSEIWSCQNASLSASTEE